MSRADVNDDGTTTSVYSLNLKSAQFYVALLLAFVALLAAVNSGTRMLVEYQLNIMLKRELTPPDGDVYQAIAAAIATHERASEAVAVRQFARIDLRLAYQEILMSELYTEVTGRPLPPSPSVR